MFVSVISLLHHATTLLFGVYLSAAFLGIRMTRRTVGTLFGFSSSVGVVYILTYVCFGETVTEQIYPLVIHLPLILFLTRFYKCRSALCSLAVAMAYLCCQISKWVGIAAANLTHQKWVYYSVRIVVTVVVFIFLLRYIFGAVTLLVQKSLKTILIFGFMPFVYYLFDYATSVYTALLYSGRESVAEFPGFILSIAYLLFLLLYFRQYEQRQEAERRNQVMEMRQRQSQKEIEAIRASEYAVRMLRHDMRHFLSSVVTFLQNGETERAQEYICEIIEAVDKTAVQKYCGNEIVNMILSSQERKIRTNEIDFRYSVEIPEKLPFSDVDLTVILLNGLENAIQAVLLLEPQQRFIKLDLHMDDYKLLLSIKNPFAVCPSFRDGLPRAKENGHGFGTQSICYVVEKLNGHCRFSVVDNLFVLQVIL